MKIWIIALGFVSGLIGAAGVALSAVAAHRSVEPMVGTAAHFLLVHAGALVALCAAATLSSRRTGLLVSATAIACGTILFSGEIVLHVFLGVTRFGIVAPIGGGLTILGWLSAAVTMSTALAARIGAPSQS